MTKCAGVPATIALLLLGASLAADASPRPGGGAGRDAGGSRDPAAAAGQEPADAATGHRDGRIDPLQSLYRHNRRGNRAFADGDLDEALREYVEAQGHAPDDPRVLYNLGNALAGKGKTDDALGALGRAAAGADDDRLLEHDARFNEGVLQMGGQDYEGALRSFGRALTIDPADADARRNLELVLRRMQQQQQQQQNPTQEDQKTREQKDDEKQNQQGGQDQDGDEQKKDERKDEQGEPQPRPSSGKDEPRQGESQEADSPPSDEQREAARRLLQALENAEKEALREALRRKLPDLPDREEDW